MLLLFLSVESDLMFCVISNWTLLFWAYGGGQFQISKFPSKFGFIYAIALQIGLLTCALIIIIFQIYVDVFRSFFII
jgi:hypothetical protein